MPSGNMLDDQLTFGCDSNDSWDGNACTMPDHSLHITPEGSVLYNSSSGISGFQFVVDGTTINEVFGGAAEDAGFLFTTNSILVLGFSLTGASVDGCGTLVQLDLEGEPAGLSAIILSDNSGNGLSFNCFDGMNTYDCCHEQFIDQCGICYGN